MNKLLILTDDNHFFSDSYKIPDGMNVDTLIKLFSAKGYDIQSYTITEIDWSADFSDTAVLYPYSKLSGLFYKGYIEDILLRLQYKGARLLPDFLCFRAHQNKIFMELMRQDFKHQELKTINSVCFGSLQGMLNYFDTAKQTGNSSLMKFPMVLKLSVGSRGRGVFKIHSMEHLIKTVNKMTVVYLRDFQSFFYRNIANNKTARVTQIIKNIARKIAGAQQVRYLIISHKFVLQPYIADLPGDYSVWVLGRKFYVKYRSNTVSDFRFSASGISSFPELNDEVVKILDFAELAYEEINSPAVCLDIAYDGRICHLIEFQCLSFSSNHIISSNGWFIKDTQWSFNDGKSTLEEDFANAVDYYLRNHQAYIAVCGVLPKAECR